MIGGKFVKCRDPAGAAPPVGDIRGLHRVGVDTDDRSVVVEEIVIHDDRLGAADVDRSRVDVAATVAVTGRSAGVVLEACVGYSDVGLANLDRIVVGGSTTDGGRSAGVGDNGLIDAGLRHGPEIQTGPVTRRGYRIVGVFTRIEGSAGPVAGVQQGGQHNFVPGSSVGRAGTAFDDELCAHLRFDSRTVHLHDHARINPQPGIGSRVD